LIRLNLHNNQLSGCYDQNLMNLCSQLTSIYNTYFSISEGNNFDVPWDEFCNTGVGICGYAITTVYPGDFNNDGTANATDLLYWGLEVGSTGFSRFPASNDWTPQEAYWWEAVHQDGDGNGTVDFNDIATLEQNYDSTYLSIPPYTPNQGLISYELKLDSIAPLPGPQRQLYFGLYVISETGVPVSTHGLAGTIDCSLLYMELNIEPEMETMGSVLEPTADITHYDVVEKQLHFALTRTDKNNQLLGNSPVANIVVVDDLKLAGEVERIISANSGSLMHANGSAIPVGATTLTVSIGNGGGTNELTGSVITSDEQCNLPGWAKVEAENGKFPYTYQWSNGANTQIVNNLAAGDYTVTIVDNIGSTLVISSEINPSDSIYDGDGNQLDCNGERVHATLDLCVLLEGAYDNVTQQMRTTLNTERGLLPGQTPSSSLVSPTPPGQPYNQSPWNYEGIEGQGWSDMNYSSEVVDWVLVSFRTGISASTEITKTAGLLMKGGCIDFPDRNVLPKNIGSPLYIVIEHRNHMGIMTTTAGWKLGDVCWRL